MISINYIVETLPKTIVLAFAAGIGCFLAAILAEFFLFLTQQPAKPNQIVCLTIDVSGSMMGNKIEEVQSAAISFINNCDFQKNRVAVTIFSSDGTALVPLTDNKSTLINHIRQITAYGGTNFEAALQTSEKALADQGKSVAQNQENEKKTLLIFTDGVNSEGNPFSAVATAERLRNKGVQILAIATDDADSSYLNDLTADSNNVISVKGGNIQDAFKEAEERIFTPQLMQTDELGGGNAFSALLRTCIWTTILCFGIALGLVGMQNTFLKKRALTPQIIAGLIVGAAIAGCAAGGCGQLFFILISLMSTGVILNLGRIIAWAVLGAVMALLMARFIPNLNIRWAWRGGILGGIFGAIGFLVMNYFMEGSGGFGDVCGRLTGAFALGFCIGFIVGMVEKVYREAWLTVVYSPKRFTQINLGEVPVTFGSGNNDTVQIDDLPKNAVRFKLENGIIQYTESGITRQIKPGERETIGKIEVVVCSPEHPYLGSLQLGENRSNGPAQPNVIKPPHQATNARFINQAKSSKEPSLPVTPPSGNDLTKKRRPIQLPPRKRS
ncbi:MAG: VWA domain-containing protein [Planctomycetia bacterium]|nr:VWA domain-containing protein [Planctomycetia bacterium]